MTDRILPEWVGKKEPEDFQVYHNGEVISYVNWMLANKQGLSWEAVEKIKELHAKRRQIFDWMREMDCNVQLYLWGDALTELEFELQDLWNFDRDSNFHRHWEVPKCTCPKLDNRDSYPHGSIINCDCPVHGMG